MGKAAINPTIEDIEKYVVAAGSDNVAVFGGLYEGGAQIQQVPDEIAPCIKMLLESGKEITSFLEIGTAAGGTTFLFDHFFHPKVIVLVDDNKHHKADVRGYVLQDVKYKEIIGDSHDENVLALVKDIAGSYDMIIIDGDHSYEGVKKDFEMYSPLLSDGGFLFFHDSACVEGWGVHVVVGEVRDEGLLNFVGEYITTKHSRQCGIALFQKESK
jgi:predicted O-methyltransferase YrrM